MVRRLALIGRYAAALLIIAIALAVVGSVVGVLPYTVVSTPGISMTPTVRPGDKLLVNTASIDPGEVARNDIVVVADPAGTDRLVKRVVATAGQTVGLEDGVLVVDGAPVPEPWSDPALQSGVFFGPLRVPPGTVFVMGDDRRESIDSRVFGPVTLAAVQGRVALRLAPRPGSL